MGIFDSLFGKQKLPDWYKGEIYKNGGTIQMSNEEGELTIEEIK